MEEGPALEPATTAAATPDTSGTGTEVGAMASDGLDRPYDTREIAARWYERWTRDGAASMVHA